MFRFSSIWFTIITGNAGHNFMSFGKIGTLKNVTNIIIFGNTLPVIVFGGLDMSCGDIFTTTLGYRGNFPARIIERT